MALAIFAAVALGPPWAELAQRRYERDRQARRVEEGRATRDAWRRLRNELQSDPVLVSRQAQSSLGLVPANEVIVPEPGGTGMPNPATPAAIRLGDPPPPTQRDSWSGWWISAGAKLRRPARRNGMMMIAGAMLAAALLLFAPPARKKNSEPPADERFPGPVSREAATRLRKA
jgi:hypothetical protein